MPYPIVDVAKLRADYITSLDGLRVVAERNKVSFVMLAKLSRKEGWVKQRKEYQNSVSAATIIEAAAIEVDRNIKHLQLYDMGWNQLHTLMQKMADKGTLVDLRDAMTVLKIIQEGQRKALGLDREQSRQTILDSAQELLDGLKASLYKPAD